MRTTTRSTQPKWPGGESFISLGEGKANITESPSSPLSLDSEKQCGQPFPSDKIWLRPVREEGFHVLPWKPEQHLRNPPPQATPQLLSISRCLCPASWALRGTLGYDSAGHQGFIILPAASVLPEGGDSEPEVSMVTAQDRSLGQCRFSLQINLKHEFAFLCLSLIVGEGCVEIWKECSVFTPPPSSREKLSSKAG